MDRTIGLAASFIGVTVVYSVLSTIWVSADPGWYDDLRRPSFQPPDVVFGIIWPLNFLALGVVGVLVSRRAPGPALSLLVAFVVSVVFALGWAYLFYVPHALVAAAISLGLAAILTWVMVVLAWRVAPGFGIGLVVYAGWLTVATVLAAAYAQLN
ncbi:MAG: TspO/MBR family protein [Nocardioides sp.]